MSWIFWVAFKVIPWGSFSAFQIFLRGRADVSSMSSSNEQICTAAVIFVSSQCWQAEPAYNSAFLFQSCMKDTLCVFKPFGFHHHCSYSSQSSANNLFFLFCFIRTKQHWWLFFMEAYSSGLIENADVCTQKRKLLKSLFLSHLFAQQINDFHIKVQL